MVYTYSTGHGDEGDNFQSSDGPGIQEPQSLETDELLS